MPLKRIESYKSVLDLPSIQSPGEYESEANCHVRGASNAGFSGRVVGYTPDTDACGPCTSGRVSGAISSPDSAQTVIKCGNSSKCQIPKIRFKRNAEAAGLHRPAEPVLLTPPQKRIRTPYHRIKVKGPSLRTLLKEWVLALDLGVDTAEETLDLSLHIFSRYQAASRAANASWEGDVLGPSGSRRKAELAACLWLGMKLDGLQVDAPCVFMMAMATGSKAQDIRRLELEIASALDWKLMEGFVGRAHC